MEFLSPAVIVETKNMDARQSEKSVVYRRNYSPVYENQEKQELSRVCNSLSSICSRQSNLVYEELDHDTAKLLYSGLDSGIYENSDSVRLQLGQMSSTDISESDSDSESGICSILGRLFLPISGLRLRVCTKKIIILFLNQNICCGN